MKAVLKRELYKRLGEHIVQPRWLQVPTEIVSGSVLAELAAMLPKPDPTEAGAGEAAESAAASGGGSAAPASG